ncbi:IS66 family insertion sequence element accessory protein TnpB [Pendulispora rubella]|uniref:IS66 family insertion sequence element accessory protein TnpB n=1 Tax=Pendulispora rubella TaxID=2741070 RepID=A0ABZ2LGG3_9BACT
MIPHGMQIFLAVAPIDLRWGFDRLAGIAKDRVGYDPRGGAMFIFFGKRRTTLKVIFYDGTGLCIFMKRLDKGGFRVPAPIQPDAASIEMTDAELEALLDAIDIDASPPRREKKPSLH